MSHRFITNVVIGLALGAIATSGFAAEFAPVTDLSDSLLATLDASKLALFLVGAFILAIAGFFRMLSWAGVVGTIIGGGLLLGNMSEVAGWFNIT